ncbi:hypothetical protein [Ruegeria sp. HKCCD7303]|uniref:hypothetical protein n=1 Tax=Ruegeria sp. HKCCD7303 TaxID=2683013 RepID=UPI0014914559|nr:hypothetical protein [Ruegeria sp. HKCCD7303]NOD66001.1 hypothetical protein [Ruegeria sp. HKCCD7303]
MAPIIEPDIVNTLSWDGPSSGTEASPIKNAPSPITKVARSVGFPGKSAAVEQAKKAIANIIESISAKPIAKMRPARLVTKNLQEEISHVLV